MGKMVWVANAPGEDYEKYVEIPNALVFWMERSGREPPTGCPAKSHVCTKKVTDGGHVKYCGQGEDGKWYFYNSNRIFITPMCHECNILREKLIPFLVDEEDLVEIDYTPRR